MDITTLRNAIRPLLDDLSSPDKRTPEVIEALRAHLTADEGAKLDRPWAVSHYTEDTLAGVSAIPPDGAARVHGHRGER